MTDEILGKGPAEAKTEVEWVMLADDPELLTSEMLRLHGDPWIGLGTPVFLSAFLTHSGIPPSARPWPTRSAPWVWSQPCDFGPEKDVLFETYSQAQIREISKVYADLEWLTERYPEHKPGHPKYVHLWGCLGLGDALNIFDERRAPAEISVDLALTVQQRNECAWLRGLQ